MLSAVVLTKAQNYLRSGIGASELLKRVPVSAENYTKNQFVASPDRALVADFFDQVTKLTAHICDMDICFVVLFDKNRRWIKSSVGLDNVRPKRISALCDYALKSNSYLEIDDFSTERTMQRFPPPIGLQFYASAILRGLNGFQIGTLCIADKKSKTISLIQRDAFKLNARSLAKHIELTRLMCHPRNKSEFEIKRGKALSVDNFWSRFETLTRREKEVLRLICDNSGTMTNKEIAREFGISHRTVELHRSKVKAKIEAETTSELIVLSLKAGF